MLSTTKKTLAPIWNPKPWVYKIKAYDLVGIYDANDDLVAWGDSEPIAKQIVEAVNKL